MTHTKEPPEFPGRFKAIRPASNYRLRNFLRTFNAQ